jgi:integrase
MKWDHLDAGQRVWTIPADDMKSGRLHEVPLSEMAHGILGGWPRMAGPYVFGVGSNGSHPYAGASNGMDGLRARLREDHGYEPETPWRLHDLRRTAVTLAQRGGASIEEIRALTQHKTPGVIGIYARHAYSVEKRLVADIIAAEVHAILNRRSAV